MRTLFECRPIWLMTALLMLEVAPVCAAGTTGEQEDIARRGQQILQQVLEANRYWLISPPKEVGAYSYVFHLNDREPMTVKVANPGRTGQAQRQGITWYSILQATARKPFQATVTEISETNGVVALSMRLDPAVRGHCGNGIEGTWTGYFNLGGDFAEVVIDLKRKVPLRSVLGNEEETYGDFVQVDKEHLVPLMVTVEKGDSMRFEWRFRLYAPGLWLLDYSEYGGRKVAWVDGVRVGEAVAQVQAATVVSVQREEAERAGSARLAEFLAANRHWLLPSMSARRGLVYDYEQEGGYRERVMFDPNGDLMVQLESTRDKPDVPTRERLWTAGGQKVEADHSDPFVKATELPEAARGSGEGLEAWLHQDRAVQHLAMGLALDCALTRLAREPEAFGAETLPVKDDPGRYLLVLHPRKTARLFAGTMLMFTSWAYMHDVGYSRSEVLCDATTQRPIEEKDFDGKKLVGQFRFEDWVSDGTGFAPGRISGVMPYEKDKKDNSLEMEARFQVVRPNVWLLDRVESSFRGNGGSTGRVQVVTADAAAFEPIQNLLARLKKTDDILHRVAAAKPETTLQLRPNEWQDVALAAEWTEAAKKSASWNEDRKSEAGLPVIGIYRARALPQPDGSLQVELEGLSTASWKEFETEWRATAPAPANAISKAKTTAELRAENSPAPFTVKLDFPATPRLSTSPSLTVSLEGTVMRMSGAYHGHGMWFRFSKEE